MIEAKKEETKELPVSYRIFITKSVEAARIMRAGLMHIHSDEKVVSISQGCVEGNSKIPAIYHEQGDFYTMIEYQNGDTGYPQKYEIIFC